MRESCSLHHKEAGLIFSFFNPITRARIAFKFGDYRTTNSICTNFYKEFDVVGYEDLFRITDKKPYNDKQLELLSYGISSINASYTLITRHHVNAVAGLLKQGVNINIINDKFAAIQAAEWYQLDLMSLGLALPLALAVNQFNSYQLIIQKYDDGLNIDAAYNEVIPQPACATRLDL